MTKITEISFRRKAEDSIVDYLRNFSKRMLKTQVFIGIFEEKRYVEALKSYRDVVRIDVEETQFIENLQVVNKKLRQELNNDIAWIGITDPNTIGAPVGYSLWTVLPLEVFGRYWFKVKSIVFIEHEVRLKLDVIRPVKSEHSSADTSANSESQEFDFKTALLDVTNNFQSNFTGLIKKHVTLTNIKSTAIFLSLLITTILAGAVNLVKYFMEYFLKFMTETSKLIKVCTPILIRIIDVVRSVTFGLFSMIVVLVRGKPSPQVIYVPSTNMLVNMPPQYMLEYPSNTFSGNRLSSSPYKSSVTIEPIDD